MEFSTCLNFKKTFLVTTEQIDIQELLKAFKKRLDGYQTYGYKNDCFTE